MKSVPLSYFRMPLVLFCITKDEDLFIVVRSKEELKTKMQEINS